MKAYAIVVPGNQISMSGFNELKESYDKYGHDDGFEMHEAIELNKVEGYCGGNGLFWNYPWEGQELDMKSGMLKSHTTLQIKENVCHVF